MQTDTDYVEFPGQANILSQGLAADMIFRNLSVKQYVFDMLQLPFEIKYAFIDTLKLHIHWTAMLSEPTEVFIEDITVVIQPRSKPVVIDESIVLKQQKDMRHQQLDAWEELYLSKREQKATLATAIVRTIAVIAPENVEKAALNIADRRISPSVRLSDETRDVTKFSYGFIETLHLCD